MKFAISSVLALLVASAHAASVPVLHRRIDGCPDNAPWPVGSPGDYWYPVCCPYTLGDVSFFVTPVFC